MQDLFNVKNRVVAITGGGGVLCGALAVGLAGAGAKVAVLDLSEAAAQAVAQKIAAGGGCAAGMACNALSKESLQAAERAVVERFGPVDILINGVGGNKKEATATPELPFFDLPAEAVQFVFNLNFLSAFLTTQVFARSMAERKSGVILNITSMNALRPLTKIPAYSAAKASISNFTQWLAVHLCQNYSTQLRVNALAPGFFLTEQNRFLLTEPSTGGLTERGKTIIAHTPMGRFGEAAELLGAVQWLVSDAARFVTGTVVAVDGGFSAFSGV